MRAVERGEHRSHSNETQVARADLTRGFPHLTDVERHNRPAVVIVAALDNPCPAFDERREIRGPVTKWRKRCGCRRADPDAGHWRQIATLDHRVGEMRRPDQ